MTTPPAYEFVGCYKDGNPRALQTDIGYQSTENCFAYCKQRGKFFFGMQAQGRCWCGWDSEDSTQYARHGESDQCTCDSSNRGSGVFCMYQIFDPDRIPLPPILNWHNVALRKPTSQSSTHYHHGRDPMYAAYAVDGCTNGNMDSFCVTHTRPDYIPWWRVNLQGRFTIQSIYVKNRSDCCRDRLRGFILRLYNGDGFLVYDSNARVPGYTWSERSWYTFQNIYVTADRAEISVPASNRELSLTEVEIIGTPVTASPTRMPTNQPTVTRVCETLVEKVTNELPTQEIPLALYNIPSQVNDPFAGYYDVQRCGKCNDWCGWVGVDSSVGTLPPNPWFKTSTSSRHFMCKLAEDTSEAYGMTVKEHFDDNNPDNNFQYQKCSGNGADTPTPRKEKFLGCFRVSAQSLLPVKVGKDNVPFYDCADACRADGYHYFGRKRSGQCRCGGTSASDTSYADAGKILSSASDYCGDCLGDTIGEGKQCVFRIMDQFDPEVERNRHPCSHITMLDVRRYCYVACRDKDDDISNLALCASLTATGLIELSNKISNWADSPLCDTKDCEKYNHPLGGDVKQSKGTF